MIQIDEKRSYKSIVKRGLINKNTTFEQQFHVIEQEMEELYLAKKDIKHRKEELADVIIASLTLAELLGIDIEKEIANKIEINEKR